MPASAPRTRPTTRAPASAATPAPATASRRASSSPRLRGRGRQAKAPEDLKGSTLARLGAALSRWVRPAPRRGAATAKGPARRPDAAPSPEAAPEKDAAPGKSPPRAPRTPAQDPAFQQAKRRVGIDARQQRSHEPAAKKRTEAEKASAMEPDEQIQQSAKEKTTGDMERVGAAQQSAGRRFSAEGFKTELVKRIAKKRPRTEDEAKDLAKNPPLEHFEQDFSKNVAEEQGKVTGPLQDKAAAPPTGGVVEKPLFNLPKPAVPRPAAPVDGQLAAPKPRTDEEISHQKDIDGIDGAMAKNRLSDDQLADSREPKFVETLNVKNEARRQAAEAPAVYRAKEAEVLRAAQAGAGKTVLTNLGAMRARHIRSGAQVHDSQGKTETETERRQREIKSTIDGIYQGTVAAVTAILGAMASQVKEDFARTLKEKTDDFNAEVRRRISDYYGDWRIDDELFGPDDVVVEEDGSTRAMTPEERFGVKKAKTINPDVYQIFVQEKDRFVQAMNGALDGIAANVEAGLSAAHNQILLGEAAIAVFKAGLKGSELEYAERLEQEVKMKFENLEASIDDAREDLLQTLADQYTETVDGLEKSFNEINDELKKSWLDRALEFIETVGKTIFQLADLLLTILSRMARLIWSIIKHPIRFFETLVKGLMQGVGDFISNIGENLKEGFWTWITGASSAKGIHLSSGSGPAVLFDLVLQVLSLQPADLRAIAEKVLGRETMELIDKGIAIGQKAIEIGGKVLEPVIILFTKGPGALWEYLKETLADMVRSTFDRIREAVFNTFVEKGLKWIAGFFIPGGGFVKVIKAVFAAFQFVVENLDRIRAFFDSVFDSMEAATEGRTDGVAAKIVAGLKLGVVLALDFLAKQLGLGKIVDGVQKVIHALRRPIVAAIEWLLNKVKPFVTKVVHGVAGAVRSGVAKLKRMVFPPKRIVLPEETHTMQVEGDRYDIALYSNRMLIPEIVAKARSLGEDPTKLETKYRQWTAMELPTTPEAERKDYAERSAAFQEIYQLATPLLETIFGAGETTKIAWGGLDGIGRASYVQANPLTKKGVKGSPPSEEIPGHDTELTYAGERISYIRTHLLHHELGGPGRSINLTPTSNSLNRTIFNRVEEPALKQVAKGEALVYTVNAYYKDRPTDTEVARVKLGSSSPLSALQMLRRSAQRMTYHVTNKKTGKLVVPHFDEENWK